MANLGQMLMQGPNSGSYTPETLDRRRKLAQAMLGQSMGVQQIESPWQGLAQMLQAGIGGYQVNRADEEEAAAREQSNAKIAQLLSGGMDAPMSDLAEAAGDPWASDGNKQLATMLLGEQVKKQNTRAPGPDFGFIELPNGQIVRTDSTSGTIEDMGQFGAPAEPDQPASVDEYNWWAERERAAGREPLPYLDFVQAQKGGGLSITTNPDGTTTITQGGGKFGQTADTAFGGTYADMQNAGLSAISGLDTLDAMEQAMADPSFYSGFGAEQLLGAKRFAAALGIDPEGVTSMEAFNGLSKQSALAAMGGSLGAGFSNADRSFVEQQVPSLANTPEGNVALAQIQRKLLERKIEIADLAERYVAAKGKLDGGFTTMLAEWSEANPLFSDAAQGGAGDVAVNPQTGEIARWNGNQWVPE